MTGEQFTQIKRPVSRLTEKVLGWLCWVMLLVLTVITMFIALVSFSNNTSIANLENTLNNNAFIQQLLAGNGYNTTQFVIWLQNGIWAIIVYFIVCLLISFLALISMNIRIFVRFLILNISNCNDSFSFTYRYFNHSDIILYYCDDAIYKKR